MLLPHRAGIATGSAVVSGAALALTIAVAGKSLATRAPLPMVRAAGLFAFTATASFAAWHAVTSLTALLIGASAWRTIRALLAAFLVGAASWREVAGGADRRTAG
uniref:hypothetical protein n=1 Tax=Sphingomonas sp. AR_OL41 TaxID=3042729 RepID=UPI00248098E4|nr:hypothetical protein [Sphingomonas sp. AR_OL41]